MESRDSNVGSEVLSSTKKGGSEGDDESRDGSLGLGVVDIIGWSCHARSSTLTSLDGEKSIGRESSPMGIACVFVREMARMKKIVQDWRSIFLDTIRRRDQGWKWAITCEVESVGSRHGEEK